MNNLPRYPTASIPIIKTHLGGNTMKTKLLKRITSTFLCLVLLMSYLPLSVWAASGRAVGTSVTDPKTLSQWESIFSPGSSRYAGQIFLDKSVYTATEAKTDDYFKDIRSSLTFGQDNFGNENFMIALSALGSNSEIHGYSHNPTDTMLVLDASTSMGTGAASTSSIDDMVSGANEAIKRLISLNNYNRVGVVVYNGTSSVLLPLDRYTANNANGDFLVYSRTNNQNRIYIAENVKNGNNQNVSRDYIAQAQGTYTQGGIYSAAQQFLAADPTIEEGKIQGGTHRIPILVLMTDGEPSYRTVTGSNNTINKYNAATNTNVDKSNFREDEITAFSTMLTAAWAESEITAHYGTDTRFYTLGYALSANHQYAQNVLDPTNPNNALATRFATFATQYLAMQQNATAAIRNEYNQVAFQVTRSTSPERVTSLDYVDRYWQASQASQLHGAFDAIVDEIIIQSRYYSTLVSHNNYAQDGFISFTDEIGSYMEVKNVKGIYIGDGKLVSGGMFAEFSTTGSVHDYGNTNYDSSELTDFENEILRAVSDRFSVSLSEAALLINTAKERGFISYTSPTDFSNYIAWYADADNAYLAPYTGTDVAAPANAKYIVRSYFYMGDVMQNHVETSMLYALVRIREDIQTGRQIVDMNVPAALLPQVTYTITVDGDTFNSENVTGITCESKKPLSLLFEVGLDDEITPINISEKVGEGFRKDANGIYTFYTNRWRDDAGNAFTMPTEVNPHVFNHGIINTTVTQFIPSLENQHFYYTENTQILDASHNVYIGSKPTVGGTYYAAHNWVEGNGSSAVLKTAYNPIPSELLTNAESIIELDGKAGWFIQKGTPQFYFGDPVHGESAHNHKTNNATQTLGFSDYPQVVYHDSEEHHGYHMLNYLGNNGMIQAEPAQGIKLSKTVSQKVNGAPDTFSFEIVLNGNTQPSYSVYTEHADGTASNSTVNLSGDKLTLTLADGDTAYIYNIDETTSYTVTEIPSDYYTASSHNASGTVLLHSFSEVNFVNTPKGFGSLLVEKDVTHPFETVSPEMEAQDFDISVIFTGSIRDLAQIQLPQGSTLIPQIGADSYTYHFTLKDGHDLLFTHIPEGVTYTVSESNLPVGYTLETSASDLSGAIAKNIQSQALLVNRYAPAPVSPLITVCGEKNLVGRAWNDSIDHYQVALQQVAFGGQGTVAIGSPITAQIVKTAGADYQIDLSSLSYTEAGTYSYAVYEVFPEAENRVDSISYDTSMALFSVTVIDKGTGTLIIDRVQVHQNTATVSGDAENGWTVTKDFTNTYQSVVIRFPVIKQVLDEDNGSVITDHRGGIMFALFESTGAASPAYSTLTDAAGNASFAFPIEQSDYATARYYYLREVIPLLENQVVGMTYNTSFQYAIRIEWANASDPAPSVRYYRYDASAEKGLGAEITDLAATPLTIINTFDDEVSTPALSFGGQKTLNGSALRDGDSFTFELYESDASFAQVIGPKQTRVVNAQTANGAYLFDQITFSTVGTKYLVVQEADGGTTANGITYDNTVYHITVEVTKSTNANNKTVLNASIVHIHKVGNGDVAANALNFNNVYTVNANEEVIINGTKTLHGRPLVEGEFEFEITALTEGAPLPSETKVKNNASGSFSFPAIRFAVTNQANFYKEYAYRIKEVVPTAQDQKGITYNSNGKASYELVVILQDNGRGGIQKTVKLDGQTVTDINVSFENLYAATGTELTLKGSKFFNRDSGEFQIDLYQADDNFTVQSILKNTTVQVTAGKGDYSITLPYTVADKGYHYYVLKEAVPAQTNGVLYDATQYHITVNALDNGHGEMEAHVIKVEKAHTAEIADIQTLDFVNHYSADFTEYVISGEKTLENKALDNHKFQFVLKDADGEIATVENASDGRFAFPAQVFEAAGNYQFTVEEVGGGSTVSGITYDAAKFTVTIPVLDDGVGNLYVDEANIKYEKQSGNQTENATAIRFVNRYAVEKVNITVNGKKVLENRELKENEFKFFLYPADSAYTIDPNGTVAEAKNLGNGTFAFDALSMTQAGTYYFVVKEDPNTTAANVVNDTAVYHVAIEIKDNGEGQLYEAGRVIEKVGSTSSVTEITFTNVFNPPPVNPDIPKTGDSTDLHLWIALLFVSGGSLFGTTLRIKKEEEKAN